MTIPIITGATASGKTSLAIEIAQLGGYEIISADSRQVYKECNIATATPSAKELEIVPHHLISTLNLNSSYSAGKWCIDVIQIVEDIEKRGKKALICGGTPFYIHSLLNGLFGDEELDDSRRENIRDSLLKKWNEDKQALFEQLKEVDSNFARSISPNDKQRVIRGLEIHQLTQKPMSSFFEKTQKWTQDKGFEVFVVDVQRDVLYQRINKRVDEMMENGLKEEVTTLYKKYGDFKKYNGLNTVGYVEWISYFNKQCLQEHVIEEIKKNSRRFAKRQETFFRNKLTLSQRMSSANIKTKILSM